MNIKFYYTPDETNKINKTLNSELVLTGNLKQESSIIKPVILIEATSLVNYNYCYIPEFNRYYFITDLTIIKKNLWRVSLRVDVLMSFKDEILECPIILSNTQTTELENYLPSDVYKSTVKFKTDIINFPSGLNDTGEYILITAGG